MKTTRFSFCYKRSSLSLYYITEPVCFKELGRVWNLLYFFAIFVKTKFRTLSRARAQLVFFSVAVAIWRKRNNILLGCCSQTRKVFGKRSSFFFLKHRKRKRRGWDWRKTTFLVSRHFFYPLHFNASFVRVWRRLEEVLSKILKKVPLPHKKYLSECLQPSWGGQRQRQSGRQQQQRQQRQLTKFVHLKFLYCRLTCSSVASAAATTLTRCLSAPLTTATTTWTTVSEPWWALEIIFKRDKSR